MSECQPFFVMVTDFNTGEQFRLNLGLILKYVQIEGKATHLECESGRSFLIREVIQYEAGHLRARAYPPE